MEQNTHYTRLLDSALKGMEEYFSKELSIKVKRDERKAEEKEQNSEVKGVC